MYSISAYLFSKSVVKFSASTCCNANIMLFKWGHVVELMSQYLKDSPIMLGGRVQQPRVEPTTSSPPSHQTSLNNS